MLSGTSARITAEINRQSRLGAEIAKLQEDITTQKRVRAASDDPGAAVRIDSIRRTQVDELAWSANADAASEAAVRVDASLDTIQTQLDRAHELMLAASNGTVTAVDRATAAKELRSIAADIATAMAQKDSRGQPLYQAGTAVKTPIGYADYATPAISLATFDAVPTADGAQTLGAILTSAADALELGDDAARATAVDKGLANLTAAASHVADQHAAQGLEAARIDSARDRLAANKLQLQEERGTLEDTDFTEAFALVQSKLTTLSAAQAVFAKLNQQSLFQLLK